MEFLDTQCFQSLTETEAYQRLVESATAAGVPGCVYQALWDDAIAGDQSSRWSIEELIEVEIVGLPPTYGNRCGILPPRQIVG
jgi:hypothetical protein